MSLAKKLWMTTGEYSGGGPAPSGGYVDDVFSAYTYTGNGYTQTIINGIDLAGHGGMVWIKHRAAGGYEHQLFDTTRGSGKALHSNSTAGQTTSTIELTGFTSYGFGVGESATVNMSGGSLVSWTFRKAPKFFDVVTYTGDGTTNRRVTHSLSQSPGAILVKKTSGIGNWITWHRTFANLSDYLMLNNTGAVSTQDDMWGSSSPTNTDFGINQSSLNALGATYVAYLFAHDPSADGIIQCGSFTGNTTVNIGWEPQWIMIKRTDASGDWIVIDSMRGCSVGGIDAVLNPNVNNAESTANDYIDFTATGFISKNLTGTYIYTVIRRPNKPPTSGTQVYNAIARTGTGAAATVTGVGFAPDLVHYDDRFNSQTTSKEFFDALRGWQQGLTTHDTSAEFNDTTDIIEKTNDGVKLGSSAGFNMTNVSGVNYISHFFRRAPGVFDIVVDTGTGVAHSVLHGLAAAPQLIIRKARTAETQWEVWHSALAANEHLVLNSNAAKSTSSTVWNNIPPSASTFSVGTDGNTNQSDVTYINYLFATLPGISKVGSYTGNGSTQTIPCGFSTGSRFVLVKRIDNTGDWFVWDTARGITPTTDPHLSLNTTAAEVTTDDSIDQDASGFVVNQNVATNINALGGNYLFLAIA